MKDLKHVLIVGIIAIYVGYQKFYLEPLNNEALGEMFMAAQKHLKIFI